MPMAGLLAALLLLAAGAQAWTGHTGPREPLVHTLLHQCMILLLLLPLG